MASVARASGQPAQGGKFKESASTEPANASNFTMLFGQTQGSDVVDQGGNGVTAPASGFDVYFGGHVTIVEDNNDAMAGALATASGPVGVPVPSPSKGGASGGSGVARDEQDKDIPSIPTPPSQADLQSQADLSSPEEPVGAFGGSTMVGGEARGASSIPQGVQVDASETEAAGGGGGGQTSLLRSGTWGSGADFDESMLNEREEGGEKKRRRDPRDRRVQVLDGVSVVSVDKLRTALVALGEGPGLQETGKRVVELLCQYGVVDEIRVLSPTPVGYKGKNSEIVREIVADYDVVDYENECEDLDVAFCFLGHTREEVGADGFWTLMEGLATVERCNRDRVVNLAKALASAGCKHFHLLSSQGADPNSILAFLKARGEAEEAVQHAGFSRVAVYRPAFLKGKRHSSLANAVSGLAVPALEAFAPQDASINIETAALAVLHNAFVSSAQHLEVLENADMLKLGGSGGDGWIRFPELDAMDWDELWSTKTAREQWRDEAKEAEKEAGEDVVLSMFDFGGGDDDGGGAKGGKKGQFDIDMDEEKEENRPDRPAPEATAARSADAEWDFKLPEFQFPSIPFMSDEGGGGDASRERGLEEEGSWIALPDLSDIVPSFSKVESKEMETQTTVTQTTDSGRVLIYRRV